MAAAALGRRRIPGAHESSTRSDMGKYPFAYVDVVVIVSLL
jgi:hypothetical protein